MDWLDLHAVQVMFKSLLQHHSSKALILCCSDFFIVQLSHTYMTTGKTTALTRQSIVGKVMFLHFDMLSRLVIAFFPSSKCLLILWLQLPSAVTFGEQENKVCHSFPLFPHLFAMKWWDQMPWSLFLNVEFQFNIFILLFHFHQEALQFLFAFCHKGGDICIYEVIVISPSNLDSSRCFIHPGILHDVPCI